MKLHIPLFILGIAMLISFASAYTVTSLTISPSGTVTPGTTESLSYTIQEPTGQNANNIVMTTTLNSPQWSYIVYVNGQPNGQTQSQANKVTISSFLLSYKSTDSVTIGVTLSGTIPSTVSSSTQTALQIYETDSNGNQIGTPYSQTISVASVSQTTQTSIPTTIVATTSSGSFSATLHSSMMTTTNDNGELNSGAAVSGQFQIGYSNGFPNSRELVFSTDLANPTWIPTITVNGVVSSMPAVTGQTLQINGGELSPTSTSNCALSVNLIGTAPTVSQSTNIAIYSIAEKDYQGNSQTISSHSATINPISSTAAQITTNPSQTTTSVISQQSSMTPIIMQTTSVPFTYSVTSPPATYQINTTPTESVNQLIADQNKKIDEQNTLIAEQNSKISQQNGLLDQIIQLFKGLFGMKS
jgi:hypothetical protein